MSYTKEELVSQTYSYSRIDVFQKCPMKFMFKYINKYKTKSSSVALEIGTLCHEILEKKFEYLRDGKSVQYKKLQKEFLLKIKEINYGLEYIEKINIFSKRILKKEDLGEWMVLDVEQDINFKFNGYDMIAKIDRIDVNKNGDFRVIDYKTNKDLYEDKDLKTPLQMYIYALAIKEKYGKYPIEFGYDMIFHNEIQLAMSNGWDKRGLKKLESIFDNMLLCIDVDEFYPKPTPLCHFCEYCKTNPNRDDWYGDICEYYSLWTRENKTYNAIKKWEGILK